MRLKKSTTLPYYSLYCLHTTPAHSHSCTGNHITVHLCILSLWPLPSVFQKSTLVWPEFGLFILGDLEQVLSHGSETEEKSSFLFLTLSYSQSSLSHRLWQYSMDVHLLLKQSGLLLKLISLPQSQSVKIFHRHAEHLDKLLRGQMTLKRKQMTHTDYIMPAIVSHNLITSPASRYEILLNLALLAITDIKVIRPKRHF